MFFNIQGFVQKMSEYQSLKQVNDQWGEISVLDNGTYRVLAFGDNDEQSKQLKLSPHIPQHTYIQAMLMVLAFSAPKSAIILGLGGGALVHALRHYDPAIKLTAVELRPQVIEIAKRYFQLPLSKKLTLIEADAMAFLQHNDHKRVDVIFADLYHEEGVDKQQLTETFIKASADMLKSEGIVVLNCWKEHSVNEELKDYLNKHFSDVYACLTNSSNWIVFASKKPSTFTELGLKSKMQQLSLKLDYQLGKSFCRFEKW